MTREIAELEAIVADMRESLARFEARESVTRDREIRVGEMKFNKKGEAYYGPK